MTAMGVILGTASYMAPEQARGRPVDRRIDIWAFGCVLYEMLTARRAFPGEDIADVVSGVLSREPDLAVLPASTPPHVRALLARCLVKDPKQRLRDIGEARLQLPGGSSAAQAQTTTVAASLHSPWFAILAGAFALVAMALAYAGWQSRGAAPVPIRLAVTFPEGGSLQRGIPRPSLAFSPDGRTIVYTAAGPEGSQLWLRDLDRRR